MKKSCSLAVLLIASALLAACASAPKDPDALAEYKHSHDPAEPTNRKIFAANKFVDDHILKPVAKAYREDLPVPVQQSVHNFVGNLREPQIALNDALQGNFGRGGETAERFLINTTFGVAGLFDVASGGGLLGHQADFGQTLGVWGISSGPFVELPVLGSSDVRDSVGTAIGFVTNPFGSFFGQPTWVADIGYADLGLGEVNGRAEVLRSTDQLEASSLDYYATLRSVYQQQRETLAAQGKTPNSIK